MKLTLILFLWPLAYAQAQAPEEQWKLAINQAQAALSVYQFSQAAESANVALRIARRLGPARQLTAVSYALLGDIYRQWGRCTQARASFSRAIDAWNKQSNSPPGPVFDTIFNFLSTLCECEDSQTAAKKFRIYEAQLQRLRSVPLDDAHLLALRAAIARATGHYREAEAYYRREIEVLERTPGGTPMLIAESREALAVVLGQLGRHAESLAESENVISFLDHTRTSYPALLAGALNNAACSLATLGRKQEAVQTFDRAVRLAIDTLGEDTRFSARLMLNYARVLRENNERPAAAVMQKRGDAAFHRALLRDNSVVDVQQFPGN